MRFRQALLSVDQQQYSLVPGRPNSFPELYVDFQQEAQPAGERWSVFLHPKQDVVVQRLEIQFHLQLDAAARFFANGWQSWSESRAYFPHEEIPRLRTLARRRLGLSGDEHIAGIPRGAGYLHSWTYLKVEGGRSKVEGEKQPSTLHPPPSTLLIGSLNERTGFTLFLYDHHNGILTVRKDMDGLRLGHSFPALDFWVAEGEPARLFDTWFGLMELPKALSAQGEAEAVGWTSWYNHFTHISEDLLLKNLADMPESPFFAQKAQDEADTGNPDEAQSTTGYFQIDDGWQTAVGDWFSVRNTFPNGMAAMAVRIRAAGLQPGLWLAPFIAAAKSDLVRQHPDWLLKGPGGKPLKAGWNPHWGGWYHALDFYHPRVQEYLAGVFHTALEKWGFDLLKLDFLFAACLAPPPGKTRGQVMHEAMEWLRLHLGNRKMLACGVPLGSAFGLADYCRIGGDVHLRWEHRLLAWLRHRERVSTLASLRNTLGRWPLQGRAFANDPDVFILRKENQHLTPVQQHTLLTVNALLGKVLFTSDDLAKYPLEQMEELEAALALHSSRVQAVVELAPDLWRIDFREKNTQRSRVAFCNLSARPQPLPTQNGQAFAQPFQTVFL